MSQQEPWADGVYLKRGPNGGNCIKQFRPADGDDFAALSADGWTPFDIEAPGTDACVDTHAWTTTNSCPHVEFWQCSRAPRMFCNPLASEPKFRDQDYFNSHRDEVEAYDKAHPSNGPTPEDNARLARLKGARELGFTWHEIFAREDGGAS